MSLSNTFDTVIKNSIEIKSNDPEIDAILQE